jgi:hypothetical protein
MARIIYAVAGEGFGHASRAHLIGQRFLDAGHDVMFVASHRGLLYLRSCYGERVQEIFGLTFDYSRGYVDPAATIWKNLRALPAGNRLNKKLFEQVPAVPADLVITDFEPFSGWWAWYHRVPFISLDNEHMLIMARLEHRLRNIVPRATSMLVTRLHCIGAKAYVIINFFKAPLSTAAGPPVVRGSSPPDPSSRPYRQLDDRTTRTNRATRASSPTSFVYGFNRLPNRTTALQETIDGGVPQMWLFAGRDRLGGLLADERVPLPAEANVASASGRAV